MKIKTHKTSPLIILSWGEYKKRRIIERFPLSFLCGILILTASMSFLHDKALNEKAINAPLSPGIEAMKEYSISCNISETEQYKR